MLASRVQEMEEGSMDKSNGMCQIQLFALMGIKSPTLMQIQLLPSFNDV